MRDAPMDSLIRKMLSERTQEGSERCANENLMAAYLESSLTPKEMAEFESHVSDCAVCRETLALAIKLGEQEERRPAIAVESGRVRSRFFKLVPVAAVLALAIALIPVLYRITPQKSEKPPQNQVAALHMPKKPVQKTEISEQTARSEAAKPKAAEEIKMQSPSEKMPLEKQHLEYKKEEAPSTATLLKSADTPPIVPEKMGKDAEIPAEIDQKERSDESRQDYRAAAAAPAPRIGLNQIDVGRFSALNSVPPAVSNTPPPASMMLGQEKNAAEFRKIGDKEFYLSSGIWIDRQCAEHRDSLVIEILPVVPEHEAILKQYPDLRNLLPAMIYWSGKIYLLR